MPVTINKAGDVIITIPAEKHYKPIDQIELRRNAIYDALTEHDNNSFVGSGMHYGLVQLLKDLDPTEEQWEAVLKKPII